ncbi:MAG: glycosyltransferase family 2 protein, partial [Actinobacteria bacterium]|nr:glycosyltransferase family 2 protein [Actinomycetota bacterium]
MTTRPELDEGQSPTVAALLVTHNGARWLPTLLSTLPAALNAAPSVADVEPSAQPDLDEESALWAAASVTSHLVVPGRVVLLAVDTGSTDTSVPLVQAAGFTVLSAPSATPFGRAVAMAVAHIAEHHPDVQWLWLLHDDCAADEGALPQMLSIAVNERADVVGPKVHNWSGPRIIVERGIRLSGSGRRFYGVDRGELDQGQYDHLGGEPVLAVGTAGMLVSVAAWSALNGFDPALTTSADDIDFCRR